MVSVVLLLVCKVSLLMMIFCFLSVVSQVNSVGLCVVEMVMVMWLLF